MGRHRQPRAGYLRWQRLWLAVGSFITLPTFGSLNQLIDSSDLLLYVRVQNELLPGPLRFAAFASHIGNGTSVPQQRGCVDGSRRTCRPGPVWPRLPAEISSTLPGRGCPLVWSSSSFVGLD